MKNIFILLLSLLITQACQTAGTKKLTPCERYDLLNGDYSTYHSDGKITFTKNGKEGTVEITGADYNEMTCNYLIMNCEDGSANMNCDGASYNTKIIAISADSVMINGMLYTKR